MDTARTSTPSIAHPYAPSDLYRYLGSHGYPLVIDVRKSAAFDADEQMLPGAARVAPEHIDNWDPTHARPIVFGLLTSRVTITPTAKGRWTLSGAGTLTGLFEREIFPSGWRPQRDSNPRFGLERATS